MTNAADPLESFVAKNEVIKRRLAELEKKAMAEQTESEYTTGGTAVGCVAILLLPAWVAWQGFCGWLLWNWFAPAPFTHLSYGAACGVDVLVTFYKIHYAPTPERTRPGTAAHVATETVIRQIVVPAIILLVGWGVHLIVGPS